MRIAIPKDNLIDDIYLEKYNAANKIKKLISVANQSEQMIKTASVSYHNNKKSNQNNENLIDLFSKMLSALSMSTNNDVNDIINKIAKSEETSPSYKSGSREKKDDIKIVSKNIKDSHYQVDVSKDIVKQNNKEVIMVSCYARDAYLGRYLIKRNYFYTTDRESSADDTYNEIVTKVGAIKDRYYNEIIDISEVSTQIKKTLDGVISEIEIKEDSIGTNVRRHN